MSQTRYSFTPPSHPVLRWLVDPGTHVPPHIANVMLGELFASPKAVIAGLLNGVIMNVVALYLHSGAIFAVFIVIDVALVIARIDIVRRAVRASERGLPTPTGLYLITASSWCGLQGAMAFAAMQTGVLPLQLLAASSVMALIGPICARNYAAPRYALFLVLLCHLPFVAGAAATGERWLLIMLLQTPLFLIGVRTVVHRFQSMAIATLQAEHDSRHHARHDVLTGLLNRFGLMEMVKNQHDTVGHRFVLFYLDLDGFKPINDTFGHQIGDQMLRAVAERLGSSVRSGDVLARLGGDEFVIMAPNIAAADAIGFAERVIKRIADEGYPFDGIGVLRMGVSIGFACAPEDGVLEDDLHRKADAALYQAKAAGKGVYRRFRGPAAAPVTAHPPHEPRSFATISVA